MNAKVSVDCVPTADGWNCSVVVDEGAGATTHEVTVSGDELATLDAMADDPAALVERSFAFLLERESKESILRRFAVSEIGRYFPEYASEVGRG